jgi:hypothetical protein
MTTRETLAAHRGVTWSDRAVAAVRAAITAETLHQARRTPLHRADVETLVTRARPAALSQEPGLVGMALDMLDEALHRDPAHAAAHALAGWSRALGANHCLTRDPGGERARASEHCRRALALSPDNPEVLTLAAGILSLTRVHPELPRRWPSSRGRLSAGAAGLSNRQRRQHVANRARRGELHLR